MGRGQRRLGAAVLAAMVLGLAAGPVVAVPRAPSSPDVAVDPGDGDLQGVEGLTGGREELGPAVVVPVPQRVHVDPAADGSQPDGDVSVTSTSTPKPVDVPRRRLATFEESTRDPFAIPAGLQPYQSGQVNPVPFGLVDTTGVRVFKADWDGKVYDHPVAQAQYALNTLESYRLTGDRTYLDVAVRNAQRIIDRRHVIDGAWYFPYDFDFDLYRNGVGVLTAPWSSGMSSGQALSVFVRLHEVTGEQRWRDAADRTFQGFLQEPDGRGYFSAFVDTGGLLWLEEYSRYPVMDSERVLNGHMWSMFGIWDYWMMNDYDHADAEQLWRGALYTVEKTAMSVFRNKGWSSYYSVWQHQLAPTYHQYHQQQFLMLYRMSRDSVWVSRASAYRVDWPEWRPTRGFAVITPRTTVAYRLDDGAAHIKNRTMKVLESKKITISKTTGAAYDRRGKIPGGPNVIRLSAGWLAGWYVAEGWGKAWSREPVEQHAYEPEDVKLFVSQDTRLAVYRFDAAGNQLEGKLVTLRPGVFYPTDRSAYVGGRPSYQLTGAGLTGWWLPEQTSVKIYRMPGWRVG